MNQEEIDLVAQAGAAKYHLSRSSLARYMVRSVLAGLYLAVGMFASNVCIALFAESMPPLGKVLGAFIFGIGLVSIVMLGGELFTGNNMVLAVAALEKKVPFSGMIWVWLWCYLGNAIGSVLLTLLFVWGGSMNALLTPMVAATAATKLALSAGQMVFRGILCNFIVCAAVLAGIKMKEAGARIATILLLVFCFVVCGFEHSVANMGFYTMALYLSPEVSMSAVLRSMLWVTAGNIIGGSVLLAVPFWLAGRGLPLAATNHKTGSR